MKHKGSMPQSQGSPATPTLSLINAIPRNGHISLRFILNLSSHLRQGVPKGLFPVGLPVKSKILQECMQTE